MGSDYRTIASAPRDGTVIEVTDFESGFFPMLWNKAGTNELVSKEIGIWETSDASLTWCEDDGFGPTHWCPLGEGRLKLASPAEGRRLMPDISMCPSASCPSRSTCRRNEASGTKPSDWQSWMDFDATRGLADRCGSYWPTDTAKGEGVGNG